MYVRNARNNVPNANIPQSSVSVNPSGETESAWTEKSIDDLQLNDPLILQGYICQRVFKESTHHRGASIRAAIDYLPYVSSLVKNAVLLESKTVQPNSNNPSRIMMHSFYAVADIGYGPELIRILVDELDEEQSDNTIKRTYQLQNIEPVASVRVRGKSSTSLTNTTGTIKTVADLFDRVKQLELNDPLILQGYICSILCV